MPKILARSPQWLDYGTPGFDFFQPSDNDKSRQTDAKLVGPSRKIAHRGTEVFTAVRNEVRWSDLAILKDAGEGSRGQRSQSTFKVLKTPGYLPITQLTVSPSGDFLAVLTSHTCHVCVLPPREHLNFQDSQPIKPRSFQVGPLVHVVEAPSLVSGIWHPLSPSGNCLVTVTKDASVRLWELDQNDRSTFNEPALAVDLKKLANAATQREDFSASKRREMTNTFSPDDVEMQVAASCFGGSGRDDEDGWSSMTLWVAMDEGDVYALCPFLPSKFWTPSTLLPSLSTSVVSKQRILDAGAQGSEMQRLVAHQQSTWLADVDSQDPTAVPGPSGTYDMEVYSRPERLSAIPRLQGPFQLLPEPDFGEITDVHVIAPKVNEEALFDSEDDFQDIGLDDGLSVGIICLATNSNQVHVCLDLEGVEAEWLPLKRGRIQYLDELEATKDLLLLETLDLQRGGQGAGHWSTFTTSPVDRYELFLTQSTGIYSVSFRPWIESLENELSAPGADVEGIGFRLDVLMESLSTLVDPLTELDDAAAPLTAAIAVLDNTVTDVGYMVLTKSDKNKPVATLLDIPSSTAHPFAPDSFAPPEALPAPESRAPYQPDEVFFQQSAFPAVLEGWRRESATGAAGDIKGQVSFSPYTLSKFAEAHRVFSSETHAIGLATGELFRRCERLMSELKAQIEKTKDLSNRVNSVTGEDEFPEQADGAPELVRGGRKKIENRIQASKDKAQDISERVQALQRKVRGLGGKEMSRKEKAFAEEVARIEQSISATPSSPAGVIRMENSHLTVSTDSQPSGLEDEDTLAGRFRAVEDVYKQLLDQAMMVQKELEGRDEVKTDVRSSTGGEGIRQQKLAQVFQLLERETALVDAVSERLEKLQVATV
ncbi:hypothetical protein M409DRAFT_63395 [Zasmidium cellare ATCC 36951]|uniref:Uncharacterized protein n=1 Tax=Zasmidium cellare ATCC 36951 TaxID=1080233 RepID=A0A6A6D097_ZASCE|nr:uncharacterized protein M409DRAFT_63395 [Zasmidium cellare ATCC 36951]KAF2171838.1 hypothetical protein M409DRAFT_63395 [Zasmidium cellare ATCC 36951]